MSPAATLGKDVLIESIEQIAHHNVFQVTFTGGEVLLHKNLLFEGVKRVMGHGMTFTVNTNLTRLTDEDAKTLRGLGLTGILTSVSSGDRSIHDHISQRNGAFDETASGIKRAINAGMTVAASMVVTTINIDHVISTGRKLKDFGVTQFFATKASPPINAVDFKRYMLTIDDLNKVLEDLCVLKSVDGMDVGILECYPLCSYGDVVRYPFVASRRCSAGITSCTIGPSGDIRACSHSDVIYGNVMTTGLDGAWQSMENQRDGSLLPIVCRKCALLPSCSGGCRVDAYYCAGKYNALDPYAQPNNVHNIFAHDTEVAPVDMNEKFVVNTRLRFRKEHGFVLCADIANMGTPAPLTPDT